MGSKLVKKVLVPAAKVLYRTEENIVGDYSSKRVAVLGAIGHVSPVAVLEDDGLPGDVVQAGIQQEHVLKKQLSADEAVASVVKTGHSKHQEVGPLVLVHTQQQIGFEERVASQQRLENKKPVYLQNTLLVFF